VCPTGRELRGCSAGQQRTCPAGEALQAGPPPTCSAGSASSCTACTAAAGSTQYLYGKWEDFSASLTPVLDACGGHSRGR
jgi:hypothetical protein